jgi:hypothetical protein
VRHLPEGRPLFIPLWIAFWIAFWIAGVVTAVLLHKKGVWPRVAALAWYLLLVGYPLSQGKVNSQNHSGSFDGYFVMYSFLVIVHLAATSVLGVAAEHDIPQQEE